MTLAWLLLVAFIVLFGRTISRSIRKARQTGIPPRPLGEASLADAGHACTEFVTALREIDALRRDDSPQLERVRELNRLLDRLYPCRITRLQQDQIEMTVSVALEGKQVSWELTVDNVSAERPLFFFSESKDMGGLWIKHVEHPPFFVAECQTFSRDVLYLQRGQPIIASGCIAKVSIQWPSLLLMVADAVVSRSRDDRTVRPEAIHSLGTEPALRQKLPSVGPRFRTLSIKRADSTLEPSYQTAPLTEYSSRLLRRAEELFEIVDQQIGQRAKRYKGSFTIGAQSSSETAAKIVIYRRGLGRENGAWPSLADGIYILVRCNGGVGRAIWDSGLLRSSAYNQRLDPGQTLGIAPKHHERFAYFRLESEDETRAVAELLIECASA